MSMNKPHYYTIITLTSLCSFSLTVVRFRKLKVSFYMWHCVAPQFESQSHHAYVVHP